MCCLKFEQAAYESLTKITPGVGALVQTPEYRGVVTEVSLLRGIIKVRKENDSEAQPKAFQRKDVKILKNASEYSEAFFRIFTSLRWNALGWASESFSLRTLIIPRRRLTSVTTPRYSGVCTSAPTPGVIFVSDS